jgi:hypothetical protein
VNQKSSVAASGEGLLALHPLLTTLYRIAQITILSGQAPQAMGSPERMPQPNPMKGNGMLATTRVVINTINGADVREVAAAIWQAVIALYKFYGQNFPYNQEKLKRDLAQILLWDMTEKICVQFYEMKKGKKVERLSYEFRPLSDPAAVHKDPGSFPTYKIRQHWQVRLIAIYTKQKPADEVREFFNKLGWVPSEALTRTGKGKTERFGWLRSRGFSVSSEVYHDLDEDIDYEGVEL